METMTGRRATPAALVIAFGTWVIYMLVRVVLLHAMVFEPASMQRLQLTAEGITFACTLLALLGVLELMNRSAGSARSMLKLAVIGISIAFSADILAGFVAFSSSPWDVKWVYEGYGYAGFVGWTMFAVGIALAAPAPRRLFGFIAITLVVILWLPHPFSEPLWKVVSLEGKPLYTVQMLLRAAMYGALGLAAIKATGGVTTSQPVAASDGLRLAAKGLWLRVIAAVVVVMFTLMMLASHGGDGAMSLFKLLMMAQALVAFIALVVTGLGAVRAGRAGVPEIDPYMFTAGGGASLWAAGVSLAQLPMIYRAFYGGSEYGGKELRAMAEALSVALPVTVIIGIGLLATGLSGFAARRNNEDLRSDAQGRGIGYVVLMLVAIAIQSWMLPKADSVGSFAMLSLLAAGASLWGTVMMAKLLARGADSLEMEPGLPQASVISDAPPP